MTIVTSMRQIAKSAIYNLKYRVAFETCNIEFSEANDMMEKYHPRPTSSCITQNCRNESDVDLTIIVPAYNSEQWIDECIQSILNQETHYRYLLKIINDGSTDSTGEIINKHKNDPRVEIIHQENRGYSGARNRGLEEISSQYIMFVDSDDFILPGAISCLLKKAYDCNADIVEGNGYRFDNNGRIGSIKKEGQVGIVGVPWMKVFKADLFENIHFPEGYLYEDKIIGSVIAQLARITITIPEEVYAYRIHGASITQTHDGNPARLDSYWIMWLMQREQEKLHIESDYSNYIRAMRQVVMTYRRTTLLPENIKKSIFIGTKKFLEIYYMEYVFGKDKCNKLARAILNNQYGKYKVFCENQMI